MLLQACFPADNRLAAIMANVVILKEDLWIDTFDIVTKEDPGTWNDSGPGWRTLYGFRRSLVTLSEFRRVLDKLNQQRKPGREFHDFFATFSADDRKKYDACFRNLTKVAAKLKKLRDSVGGHVEERSIAEGLSRLGPEDTGVLVVGDLLGQLHFAFATEILAAIVLPGSNKDERLKAVGPFLSDVRAVTAEIMSVTEVLFRNYCDHMELLDSEAIREPGNGDD